MKTTNSFHRTPPHIAEFVMSLTGNGTYLDLCCGDGALTNDTDVENLISVDIDKSLLKKVKQGKKVCLDVLSLTDQEQFNFIESINENIDYILMNPPFENYKQFVDIAVELVYNTNFRDTKGIFVLPKKAITELDFSKFGLVSNTLFDKVNFGTSIVDICVLVVNSQIASEIKITEFISNEVLNPNSALFLGVLNNFTLGKTYKGTFIHDSYTLPCEFGKTEWRTDFVHDMYEYAVSTFFDEGYIPTMDEILLQIQDYIRVWDDCFTVENKYIRDTTDIILFDNYESFILNEISVEICDRFLDYVGYGSKTLEGYREVTYRVYQDSKLFALLRKNRLMDRLLNVNLT